MKSTALLSQYLEPLQITFLNLFRTDAAFHIHVSCMLELTYYTSAGEESFSMDDKEMNISGY